MQSYVFYIINTLFQPILPQQLQLKDQPVNALSFFLLCPIIVTLNCCFFYQSRTLILLFYKQVDIFQVCVIELKDREGSPLFHLEHFIEGKYIKYNSNSGYVLQDETLRCTPQVSTGLRCPSCPFSKYQ